MAGNTVRRLEHHQAQALFLDLVDEALPAEQEQAVRLHLQGCGECQAGWERYARTVQRVRQVERERAPPGLATQVMGRVRRQRRLGLKGLHLAHAHHRLPVEVLIPLLLAAAVLAFLALAG